MPRSQITGSVPARRKQRGHSEFVGLTLCLNWKTVLLSAAVGSLTTLAGIFLNNHLTFRRDLKKLRLETFERFRDEFSRNSNVEKVGKKFAGRDRLEKREIEQYLVFFEEIGLFAHRGYVDEELVDEILGDHIIEAYHDKQIMEYITETRKERNDKTYFVYFEKLAKKLDQKSDIRKRRG